MSRTRTPLARAKATGVAVRNPGRLAGRSDPRSTPLGAPSPFLPPHAATAWEAFRRELGWLCESDRAMVEIAASLRGRVLAGELIGVSAMQLLGSCLSKLGATPADRSKIVTPDEDEPEDEFFGAN